MSSQHKTQAHLAFGIGVLMALCGGTLYAWGVIKTDVQESFGWSQSEIGTVYSVGAWGTYIAFPPGRLNDVMGARIACWYCMSFMLIGFGMMYMQCLTQFSDSAVVMGLWFGLAGHGSLGMYLVALSTNIANTPADKRGLIVGFMAMGFGLSAALFSNIYRWFFLGDVVNYLGMLAITTSAMGLLGSFTVKKIELQPDAVNGISGSPFSAKRQSASINGGPAVKAPTKVSKNIALGEITGCGLATHPEFVFVSIIFALSAGSGLTIIGQLADIAISNGYSTAEKISMVAAVSYSNCFGRFLIGTLSDRTQYMFPRSYWICICSILMLFSHAFMYIWQAEANSLWVGAISCATAYGGLFSITPSFISERFGKANFGFNFGFFTISLALGNMFLTQASSAMYDAQSDEDNHCFGTKCFERTYGMLSLANVAALVIGLMLLYVGHMANKAIFTEGMDHSRVVPSHTDLTGHRATMSINASLVHGVTPSIGYRTLPSGPASGFVK